MADICTITFNPCIDKSTSISALKPEKKLKCAAPVFEPGGGGINVARAIKKLGGEAIAIYPSGGYSGKFLNFLLEKEHIIVHQIETQRHTRENMIVLERATNQQYRFGMPGPTIKETDWRACLKKLKAAEGFTYFVISGSNPSGVSLDFYSEAAEIVKEKKGKLVIDTSGDALKHALSTGIFLAKPNIGELSNLSGVKELDAGNVVDAAKKIIDTGHCEVLVVSMGPAGAILVTANEYFHEAAPAIKIKSTVGAGDSMVAGILIALQKKLSWRDVLRYGVAAGTAATMNAGAELCTRENVEKVRAFFS